MPIISSIPNPYKKGFEELTTISEDVFIKIDDGLKHVPAAASFKTLALTLEEIIQYDAYEILISVGSLVPLLDKEDMIEEVIDDITNISANDEDINITEDQAKILRSRLTKLIDNKLIYLSAKASDLINNYGNVFINSRIVSDMRPIFGPNLNEPISATVIIHNLSIHYQSNDEPFHKDINLILTSEDIQQLREVLDRAEKKEELLKNMLKETKTNIITQ